MKRLFSLLLALLMMLSLCACQGNFGSVNLKAPMDIPEDGVISKTTIEQIKSENAIAVFILPAGVGCIDVIPGNRHAGGAKMLVFTAHFGDFRQLRAIVTAAVNLTD